MQGEVNASRPPNNFRNSQLMRCILATLISREMDSLSLTAVGLSGQMSLMKLPISSSLPKLVDSKSGLEELKECWLFATIFQNSKRETRITRYC